MTQSQLSATLLMVRPASFGFNAETAKNNAYQKDLNEAAQEVQKRALKEFDGFVEKLRAHQIEVMVTQDTKEPPKPDAIFPNNWFCTLPTGKIVLFPMYAPNRREEKRDEIIQQISSRYQVTDVEDWSEYEAENQFLEGTGSMIFDHEHKTVYGCLSDRTNKPLLETFARAHGYRPIYFESSDAKGTPIYHTNVMMHIGTTYAVICLESIKNTAERIRIAQELQNSDHEVMPISLEQVGHFAGNMMQVKSTTGKPYTIMSQSAYDHLSEEQRQILSIHSTPLPVDITTIETVGGGSARCMVAEIFLTKK